ncbi:MAG: hypothetical protein HY788_21290 [Deltaproteobacteria bacterium]|nr:hypothetical protein [Deltaproteobacteria bacterium]
MHVSALTRSDSPDFSNRFGCWIIRLFFLAVMMICIQWMYPIGLAQAAEDASMPTLSGTETDMNTGTSPGPQPTPAQKFEELSQRCEEQRKELTELREEYERLRVSRQVRWYLLGAGVFLVGWIIGFSARRKPKRYTLET